MKHETNNKKAAIKVKSGTQKSGAKGIVQTLKPVKRENKTVTAVGLKNFQPKRTGKPSRKTATVDKQQAKKEKTQNQKIKSVAVVKKAKSVAKKIAPTTFVQKAKPTPAKNTKPAALAKAVKQKIVKTTKSEIQKINTASPARNVKSPAKNIKLTVSAVPKVRSKNERQKGSVSRIKTIEQKNQKLKGAVSVEKNKFVKSKKIPTLQTVRPKTKKAKLTVAAENIKPVKSKTAKPAEVNSTKNKAVVLTEKIKSRNKQTAVKVKAEITLLKNQKQKLIVPAQKIEAAKSKPKANNLPIVFKPKRKKAKPISSAVFRGRRERYDFQVFPLDAEFENVPAIYVISKRKTDRNRRAHHALVCIGQTDSVSGEIKRHAKNCIKKHQANVISILPEANEKRRLKIEEDLRAAHTITCNIE